MIKYWLYLEPFTFIFCKEKYTLFYNSLSGDHFLMSNKGTVYEVIQKLTDPQEMYCIELNESQLSQKDIKTFLELLQAKCMGEIIDQKSINRKPVILYPQVHLLNSVENLQKENKEDTGKNVMNYLHHITLQLTDFCDNDCSYCDHLYKQLNSCNRKNKHELSLSVIEDILKSIYYAPVSDVRIKGGNLFLYTKFHEFVNKLKEYPQYSYYFFFNSQQFDQVNPILMERLKEIQNIKVRIQYVGTVIPEKFWALHDFICAYDLPVAYEFIIYNEEQYTLLESIEDELQNVEYTITPYIPVDSSFKEVILMNEEMIFSRVYSKKDIFRRQILNSNDFGVLLINADKTVYANHNLPKLGDLDHSFLSGLIRRELSEGHSWLRVRNNEPCNKCVYQWLCPSPSNYELTLGQMNLCTVSIV